MYCFGGNHRYRLFVIFRGNLGGNLLGNLRSNLGRNLGGNLGGNLGCKLWTEKNLIKKKLGIPTLDKLMIFVK